jgi:hypothetical protein
MLIDARLHGGAMDGSDIFKDNMPVLYEEYMITPFILSAMTDSMLKRLIKEAIQKKVLEVDRFESTRPDELERDLFILEHVFDSMFTLL